MSCIVVDHPAERLALEVVQSGVFNIACIDKLVSLLPSEAPARMSGPSDDVHSWTTGANVWGGVLAARQNLTLFPIATALLAIVLRSAAPNATFTSLAVLTNQQAIVHRDLNNSVNSSNTAVALSRFKGGGIWVQGDGSTPCPSNAEAGTGHILSFDQGVITFDSHKFHATEPWTGVRRILVGFSVKGFEALPPKLIQALQQAQFALPDIGTADIFRAASRAPDFQVGLELFSGLGRLTSHLKAHGYPGSLAVDILRSSSAASVAHSLDVVHAAPLICEWLHSPYVVMLHIAPPFFVGAQLAMAIAAIVDTAVACERVVSLELPGTSPFWATPEGQRVRQQCPHVVSLNLCCFDAEPVSTSIASNSTCFQALNRPCKCHQAKLPPETCDRVYSWNFAVRFASCLKASTSVRPVQDLSAKAATLSQPKSSKFPAMVSEHQQVVLTHGTADWPIPCMARLKSPLNLPQSVASELRTLPSGAQLLRVTPCNSAKRGGEFEFVSAWGIPRSPEEFVKAAVNAGHPCRNDFMLPPPLASAIDRNASESSESLARSRAVFFKKWIARSKELEDSEAAFKKSMAPHVSSILAPKKLLLWKELMEEYGYPDKEVFDEVTQGILLTGATPITGAFPPVFKPPTRSASDLCEWGPSLRAKILDRVRPQGEEDTVVHAKTVEERNKSWARGPLSRDELAKDSLVSRRFGLQQGAKTRLVDDMSASGVNELVMVHESPKPHGPDVIAGAALAAMRKMPQEPLSGRAYDLRSAYRQLPIHPSSLKHALVSHWNPEQCAVEIDQLLALPFGAARSVYGFLRAAASVWWLGCTCLGLMWSVFYDDFVTLARTRDVRHTDAAATTFFHLLGWQFDECGEKAFEFSSVFKALGVLFDLNGAHEGRVLIKNTPSRIDELCQLITQIVDSRTLSRAAAQRLRGRMQFCDGFLFGRASRLCLKAVTRHIHSTCDEVQGDELWESLLRFRDCLRASRPHAVVANHQEPLYLFTDACYEPQAEWCAGLGAVVFGADGKALGFFSFCASESVRAALGEGVKKTIIFELEFLALLVALVHWKDLFRNRPLVCHLDNNTARDIAISGKGRSPIAHALVTALLTLEDAGEIRCWYTRVPSPSNVADEPSRRLCQSLIVGQRTLHADNASDALSGCMSFLGCSP